MVFSLGVYGEYVAPVQGGRPANQDAYPLATDTPPAGAPAGYPAELATDPLDQWLPTPVSKQRYGGLYNNCDWQGSVYDACSKTSSQAHKSGANMKWAWLGWRKGQVGLAALTDKERAFFEADSGRATPGSFIEKKVIKPVAKVGAAITKPVSAVLSKVDPSYSKSVFGKDVAKVFKPVAKYVVKPAVATLAALYTAGGSALLAKKYGNEQVKSVIGVKPTVTGFAIGATVGAGALAVTGLTASTVATGIGTASAGVGLAKTTGLLPGTKPPATPGTAQPPLLDPSSQQAPPSALQAGMGAVGVVGGIAGLGLLALLAFTTKGRR